MLSSLNSEKEILRIGIQKEYSKRENEKWQFYGIGDLYEKFYLLIFMQNNKFHAKLFQIDEDIKLTNDKLAFQINCVTN